MRVDRVHQRVPDVGSPSTPMTDRVRRLFAYAHEREGRRLRAAGVPCLETGVGKAAAAAALAAGLAGGDFELVVLVGVAGAYPDGPPVGGGCVVVESVFGDEGARTEDGFLGLGELGLGESAPYRHPLELARRVATGLGELPLVRAATVSTCSGTDELSATLQRRTGAAIETMESAAAALACRRANVPLVELRCISNRTGRREGSEWRLGEAADKAQELALEALRRGLLEPVEAMP